MTVAAVPISHPPRPVGRDPIHLNTLELAEEVRAAGLDLALTFDFTHNSLDEIGELNPLPNGGSPGTLLDSNVREAYKSELLWLFDQLGPQYVIVGIEVDAMYEKHPDWWDAYVQMEGELYDELKARRADVHVTSYHTLHWSVDEQGNLRSTAVEVWRKLLPKIDSIAYSTYPHVALPGQPVDQYPAGYFARPHDIAPDLPILVPEFGMEGGDPNGFSESEQATVLRQMLTEMADASPAALIWHSAHDQLHLGQSSQFKESFQDVGLHHLDATPKESAVIWQKVFDLQSSSGETPPTNGCSRTDSAASKGAFLVGVLPALVLMRRRRNSR